LSSYEQKAEEQRQKDLEEKGEYETLLSETRNKYEEAKAKAEKFDQYVTTRKQSILDNYTEEEQDILGDLSLEKLEKYHDSKSFTKKVPVDNSRGGISKSAPTDFHKMTVEEKGDPAIWQRYLENFRRK